MDTAACLKLLLAYEWDADRVNGLQSAGDLLCALLSGMPVPQNTPRDRERIRVFVAELCDFIDQKGV